MDFKVYILWSESLQKFYVGHTNNIEDRIDRHNKGYERFTSTGVPWMMICTFDCEDKIEAVRLENRIKKRGIKRFLEDNRISFGR
jgi:putative endonuclease